MHVLVIGAGVQGIANAYFLHRQGLAVTVVDSAEAPGMECSYANGGGLTPSAAPPWNDPGVYKMLLKYLGRKNAPLSFQLKALPTMVGWGLRFLSYAKEPIFIRNTQLNARLCNYSLKAMKEIETDTGIDYRATDSGLLMVFRDEASQQALENLYTCLADEGLSYESLDSAATVEKEVSLKPIKDKINGSMYCATDRSGDPALFCQNLEHYTRKRGVDYRYNSRIAKLQKRGRLFAATTAHGDIIKADAVVIAAGCYSPQLTKQLGVKLPIKPAKGYSLSIPMNGWQDKPKAVIADMGLHAGMNPIGGEILRVAGMAEFAGYDKTIPPSKVDTLVGLVEGVFPEFAATMDKSNLNAWAGLRPMSVDTKGIIGKTPVENLYLSTGQGHLGWSTAAASGKIIADLITNKRPEIDIHEYSIDRY